MNELIEVNYDSGKPTVSGRKLHEALGIKTPYTQWFERMCAYGFVEGKDYILVSQKCETNNPKNPTTTVTDHEMTLDMAKEICMIQRSEIGKRFHYIFSRLPFADYSNRRSSLVTGGKQNEVKNITYRTDRHTDDKHLHERQR